MDFESINPIKADLKRSQCERITPNPFRPIRPVRFKMTGVKDFFFDFSKSPNVILETPKIYFQSFFHWIKAIFLLLSRIFLKSMKESSIGSFMRTHYVRIANAMRRLSFILFLFFCFIFIYNKIK